MRAVNLRMTLIALALYAPLPLHAQQFAPPAAAVPLAAPTGAADVAILAHWNDDTTPIYGFAFRSGRPASRSYLQLVFGQPRGFGGNWIGGASYDRSLRLLPGAAGFLDAAAAAQVMFDRGEHALHLRVPVALRGEWTLPAGALRVTPLAAAGASAGVVRFGDWEEYGGVFGEGGLRLEFYGAWAQGSVLLEQRLLGGDDRAVEPRLVLRFGYVRQPE